MLKAEYKLQHRACLMQVLNKYRNFLNLNCSEFFDDIKKISKLDNQEFISDLIIKELLKKTNPHYVELCMMVAIEAIDTDAFENSAIKLLRNKNVKDDIKMLVLSILRQKNIIYNYEDFIEYLEDPQDFAQEEISNYMNNSIESPEIQIDMIDFYINLPDSERICFLNTLIDENQNDNLANIFSLLLQCQEKGVEYLKEQELIINALLKINSPYALAGLKYALSYLELSDSKKNEVDRSIKKNILINSDFINNSIIKKSKIYKCFAGFLDGRGDFSLIFSRVRDDNKIDAMLSTININSGINSIIGFFKISKGEFNKVIKRIFSESIPAKIESNILKGLFDYYFDKTLKLGYALPYEAPVCKNLLNDITVDFDISDLINSKLEREHLTLSKIKKLLSSSVLQSWFYRLNENEIVDDIIKQIEENKISDLDEIDKISSKKIDEFYFNNEENLKEVQRKLLIQSFISSLAKFKHTSACLYSLCFDSEYLKIFISSIIDKSIYAYIFSKLSEIKVENIFQKNMPSKLNVQDLELLIIQLEEKWS